MAGPEAREIDSEQKPGAKMKVSDLLRNVAHCDPQFHVTDGPTYMINKGVETGTKRWPIWTRVDSLVVRVVKGGAEV